MGFSQAFFVLIGTLLVSCHSLAEKEVGGLELQEYYLCLGTGKVLDESVSESSGQRYTISKQRQPLSVTKRAV